MTNSKRAVPALHGYKLKALFLKDIKDIFKNSQVILLLALPLLIVLIYKRMDFDGTRMDPMTVLIMGGLMALSMGPIVIPSMTIAEEKEKYTLRTLMLSNVSAWEFLISKSVVAWLLTMAEQALIYLLVGADSLSITLASYVGILAFSSVCMIVIGAVIGVLSKNQMSTGMLTAPAMLFMLLPTMLGMSNEQVAKYSRYLPTDATIAMIVGMGDSSKYVILAVWTALASIGFAIAYRCNRLD